METVTVLEQEHYSKLRIYDATEVTVRTFSVQSERRLEQHFYVSCEPFPRSIFLSVSSSECRVSRKEWRRGVDIPSHRTLQQEEHHAAEVCMTHG